MATYQEVQDRINNEYLNRATFLEETKTAIKAAIRNYENKRWLFNETAVALATVANISYIPFPDNHLITDQVFITVNGVDQELERRDRAWLLAHNAGLPVGVPTDFATFQNRIHLHAIPDAIYGIPFHYVKKLPELSAISDTNAWLTGIWQDVIAYHAAKVVWGVTIRNDKEASKFASLEKIALDQATEHFTQVTGTGRIKPTRF